MQNRAERNGSLMIKSLHLKLVLILVLLIVAVMTIVGTYLINSVTSYYIEEFGTQMQSVFTVETFETLQKAAAESDGVLRIEGILSAYSGLLGLGPDRSMYILDGQTGACLSETGKEVNVELTKNITEALLGRVGIGNSMAESFIDFAAPIQTDTGDTFIVYIRDNREGVSSLSWLIFSILIQAMLLGLFIAIVLSFLLSKTITTPIERLTKSAKRIAEGEFEPLMVSETKDELGTLTSTFNAMATTLQQTLRSVEAEKNKLSTLLVHMTDGVVAFDMRGRLILMNPTAEKQLNTTYDDTHTFNKLFGKLLKTSLGEVRAVSPSTILQFDADIVDKKLRIFIAPFGGRDDGGIITVIHDITEQARLEDARREFVANVSHELRTPLTNVKSYTETMLDDEDVPRETEKRFLRVILNETDRMTRIVKDLLTLSRMDYDKMDWNFTRFSPSILLEDVIDAMLKDAERHNHVLTLDVGGALPDMVGDRERIEQVVINIVSNAIKYTQDGGRVQVSATAVDGLMTIVVRDTGIGIPEEDVPRLFERFYRVDKARSRERGGTGLGLAIAREIVEHHRGTIQVDSKFGQGTTVTITLPTDLPL